MRSTIFFLLMFFAASTLFAQEKPYKVVRSFPVSGNDGWDYLAVYNQYLYIAHGTQVNVIDKKSGQPVTVIPNTPGVHGIAFVASLHKGYITNGRGNNVTVFDLNTNQALGQIATGENPDAILYDAFSKQLIVCNGRGKSLSVIDPQTDKVVHTIPVNGKPETAVSNLAGKIFVNIEDASSIAAVDIVKHTVIANWPLAPGEEPSGLAIDRSTNRLFAGCDGKLVVVNAVNGSVVQTVAIGDGSDGVAFDPKARHVFSSNGDGTLTVIQQQAADHYTVAQTLSTAPHARTLTIDETTRTIYEPVAELQPQKEKGKHAPPVTGTFRVLVIQ
ncbi:YncE family protein [Niabella sp.]|uniref:YncE family protein n=1 Tax=Niabella sp. TaxID=1962976 RepID=UPI002632A3B3|nr:YncE family protein [Niabella sp.]